MRLLKLRAIINGQQIIEISHRQPVIIPFTQSPTTLIISNGFHLSRTVELTYEPGKVYLYHVDCLIDDIKLFYGIFVTFLLFGMYILTSSIAFMIVANFPVIYMLYLFYIERNKFLEIMAVGKI